MEPKESTHTQSPLNNQKISAHSKEQGELLKENREIKIESDNIEKIKQTNEEDNKNAGGKSMNQALSTPLVKQEKAKAFQSDDTKFNTKSQNDIDEITPPKEMQGTANEN